MDPITVVGTVSNVVQFLDAGAKLVRLLHQYSVAESAPEELLAVEKQLESTILVLRTLDNATVDKIDHEQSVLHLCYDQAKGLADLISSLKVTPDPPPESATLSRFRFRKGTRAVERTWKAFKAMGCMQKLEKFKASLDSLLVLVSVQQHSRSQLVHPKSSDDSRCRSLSN